MNYTIKSKSLLNWALYPAIFFLIVFAWHESHFQYDIYLPQNVGIFFHRLTVLAMLALTVLAFHRLYPKFLLGWMLPYLSVLVLYSILMGLYQGQSKLIYLFQSVCVLIAMLPIIFEKHFLMFLVKSSYILGLFLILFSTIPVLHWSGFIALENEQVLRRVGEVLYEELNPIHFGIFGLTESLPYPNHPFNLPRLQGFSFEPIHWVYFVFLTLINFLILVSQKGKKKQMAWIYASFVVIFAHIILVFSLAGFVVVFTWIALLSGLMLCKLFLSIRLARIRHLIYFGIVIFPGLILPAMLASLPNILNVMDANNFLGKQGNLLSKLGFTQHGFEHFFTILPKLEPVQQTSHNLLLHLYLQFGILLTLPFLFFLWFFLKKTISDKSIAFDSAVILAILTHLYLVPVQFFWASGVLTFMTIFGFSLHGKKVSTSNAGLGSRAANG